MGRGAAGSTGGRGDASTGGAGSGVGESASEISAKNSSRASTAARRLYSVADHAATALFAIEGATAGVLAGLDVLGVLVVGFCTALAGGILRDVLLGDVPPAAFRSPSRIVVALAGAAVTCLLAGQLSEIPVALLSVFDAAGLGLFAVTGAQKALEHRSNGLVVVILGTMTAVGGGVVRDVLLNRVPLVLSGDFYATAAAAGALVVYLATRLRIAPVWAMTLGFAVCFVLRLFAITDGWQLPSFR
ncbi:trimeric intracellular cation channel family protein [Subtercola lobariae]|uniref:trimeric intracellular cation channel family protein n=1 Tax=Subtercola lobariae TaxID=1588641 RepID=UPI001E464525|nr:trimeric intracellular cation channel family protein [Subtercola lobariae]